MTQEEAVKEVIASVVCSIGDLDCKTYCPFYIERQGCGERNIDAADAILFLRKIMNI